MSDELDAELEKRANKIQELLSLRGWTRSRWRLRNPEFRKNLERLSTAIRDTQRLRREKPLDKKHEKALKQLLLVDPEKLDELTSESLGLLLESVDQVLVDAGDAKLVCSLLEIEYARDAFEGDGPIPTWSTLHGRTRPAVSAKFAAGEEVSPADLTEARRRLSTLYRARHSLYALRRARGTTKAIRLLWLAPVLAVLAAGFIVLADQVAEDASWVDALLVALSGALGASLAAVFKLRDALPRLGDLRTFWYAFALQIPLGAVAGLFLWVVLESSLVEVAGGDEDWAVPVALGFVAGFSEPFLLKTVEHIAGGGEEEPAPGERG